MVTEATGASLTLATLTVKSWVAVAPAVSVAVTRISRLPTSSLAGVPEKVWLAASKLSQAGSGLPSARLADRLRLSPASTSLKLAAGTVKLKPASSVLAWLEISTEATGASLMLAMLIVKFWEALAPDVSVAVTRISRLPTSPLSGVPEKVLVAGSKLSQAGSGLPSARLAERLRLSPTSTSLKLAGGTVKLKPASSVPD